MIAFRAVTLPVLHSQRLTRNVVALGVSLFLAHCASAPKLDAEGNSVGIYKVGQPYQIEGAWYYPKENPNYKSTGIASWYGSKFHGKLTANGEIYNMHQLTAAHPTLPMPVYVLVTNLQNNRKVVLRVNDRGPFAKDREIDVSRKAAEKLGFLKQGTTPVRVEFLERAPLVNKGYNDIFFTDKALTPNDERNIFKNKPLGRVEQQNLATPDGSAQKPPQDVAQAARGAPPAQKAPLPPQSSPKADGLADARANASPQSGAQSNLESSPESGKKPVASLAPDTYIQLGVFSYQKNANVLQQRLAPLAKTATGKNPQSAPSIVISTMERSGSPQKLYRVRLGPLKDKKTARALLKEINKQTDSGGYIVEE